MKKTLIFFITLITVFCACACGKNETEVRTDERMISVNALSAPSDLDSVRMIGPVGKVTTSDKGACVTVTSDPYKAGFKLDTTALYLPFSDERAEKDYTDFTNTEFVAFDVFSESDETVSLDVRLVFSDVDLGQAVNRSKCGLPQTFEIKPNSWNRVAYSVKRELIPKTEGVPALTVKGAYIEFPAVENDTDFHLKDLRLYTTDKPVPALSSAVKSGEICSFDSYWQTELTRVDYYWDTRLIPQIRRETGITSDGIGASLKVTAKAGTAAGSVSGRYPGILIGEELLASVDFSDYPDDAKLCFDLFAPKNGGIDRLFLSLYVGSTRFFNGKAFYAVPGQWTTVSYTVAELNAAATDDANFEKTNRIFVRWSEFTGTDKVFYLDNFRVVAP